MRRNLMNKLILFMLCSIFITSATVLAGTPEPEAVKKAYTKAEKTCKQIARDHDKMQGEHKLMFRAWQEKSSPLITEGEEGLADCNNTLSALKDITEKLNTIVADDPLKETLLNDYENIQSKMKDI